MLPYFLHRSSDLDKIRYGRYSQMFALYFAKIVAVKAILYSRNGKGKAVPLQAWTGPEGSKKLSFPDFVTTAQDGLGCQPHAPAAFTPRK